MQNIDGISFLYVPARDEENSERDNMKITLISHFGKAMP